MLSRWRLAVRRFVCQHAWSSISATQDVVTLSGSHATFYCDCHKCGLHMALAGALETRKESIERRLEARNAWIVTLRNQCNRISAQWWRFL